MGHRQGFDAHVLLGISNASWGTVDQSHVQTVVLVPSCIPTKFGLTFRDCLEKHPLRHS
jgi:hypothetical protein